MKKGPRLKRLILLASGWGLIFLGVLGAILPIIPGFPFWIAGLLILSGEYVWAHNLLRKLRERFPKAFSEAERRSTKEGGVPRN